MRFTTMLIAAGALVASLGTAGAADAQYRGNGGYERHDDRDYRRDGDYRRGHDDRHDWRGDRGRHYGWDRGGYRHCRTEWRHHHRVRICR